MAAEMRRAERRMVLDGLRRLGGSASPRALRLEVALSSRSLDRRLHELVECGALIRHGHGQYALSDVDQFPLSDRGREIVGILSKNGIDAHLTGFDVLARHAHQFVFDYPQLVYAEPYAVDAAEAALADGGFIVVPAGRGSKIEVPDLSRLVLLRKQSDAARRFGVIGHVAPREKAWIDLLREASKGSLNFDFGELGRLLRALLESNGNSVKLHRYAARMGYDGWLAAVEDPQHNSSDADAARLAAGYRSA